MGDIAWLREGRSDERLADLRRKAAEFGVWLVWSSVHVHLSDHDPDKGVAVLELARRRGFRPDEVATIGDSPNDAGLWVPDRFGLAVGTGDVLRRLDVLEHRPAWVTAGAAADGWIELGDSLVAARTARG